MWMESICYDLHYTYSYTTIQIVANAANDVSYMWRKKQARYVNAEFPIIIVVIYKSGSVLMDLGTPLKDLFFLKKNAPSVQKYQNLKTSQE